MRRLCPLACLLACLAGVLAAAPAVAAGPGPPPWGYAGVGGSFVEADQDGSAYSLAAVGGQLGVAFRRPGENRFTSPLDVDRPLWYTPAFSVPSALSANAGKGLVVYHQPSGTLNAMWLRGSGAFTPIPVATGLNGIADWATGAVGPGGDAIVAWVEPSPLGTPTGVVKAVYRGRGDAGFGPAETTTLPYGGTLVAAVDAAGNALVGNIAKVGFSVTGWFARRTGAGTWGAVHQLSPDASTIAVDSGGIGAFTVAWTSGLEGAGRVTAEGVSAAGAWATPEILPGVAVATSPSAIDLDTGGTGQAAVGWVGYAGGTTNSLASLRAANGTWQTTDVGEALGRSTVGMNAHGRAVMGWTNGVLNGETTDVWAKLGTADDGWGAGAHALPRLEVHDVYAGPAAMTDDGRALLAYDSDYLGRATLMSDFSPSRPLARIDRDPLDGMLLAGQTGVLDATGSSDPDAPSAPGRGIVAWDWDLDGDGQYDDAHGPRAGVLLGQVGRLRVTDAAGDQGWAGTSAFTLPAPLRAILQVTPNPTEKGALVSGSAYAVDGAGAKTIEWDLDGDGQYDDLTGGLYSRRYDHAGRFPIAIRVSDRLFSAVAETTLVVTDSKAPDTFWGGGTGPGQSQSSPTLYFFSNETPATFECRVDAGPWVPCTSPHTFPPVSDGSHDFSVRAVDEGGNSDPTPLVQNNVIVPYVAPSSSGPPPGIDPLGVLNAGPHINPGAGTGAPTAPPAAVFGSGPGGTAPGGASPTARALALAAGRVAAAVGRLTASKLPRTRLSLLVGAAEAGILDVTVSKGRHVLARGSRRFAAEGTGSLVLRGVRARSARSAAAPKVGLTLRLRFTPTRGGAPATATRTIRVRA